MVRNSEKEPAGKDFRFKRLKNKDMETRIILFLLIVWPFHHGFCQADTLKKPDFEPKVHAQSWVSVGARSTLSAFDHDGAGLGTGGQFRVQFGNRVNSDWFADYITINIKDRVRSEYYHIGWSVLYYPTQARRLRPYILAGHCFDYNRKTAIADPTITKDRWGSAVQAGLGAHYNFNRFDVSLTCQYMIHLTRGLEAEIDGENISIHDHGHSTLEGHLLTTLSLNYKIFRLWKK